MAKKVKITENCVITSDDKGQRSLVGKAKEALTTLDKNNIDVVIVLNDTSKEDAANFLKENNVPYKELITMDEQKKDDKYDAFVVGDPNVILLSGDWTWTLESVVDKLYNNREKPEAQRSEQTKMDDKFKDYKHWAEEANEARKKRQGKSDQTSA